MADSTSGNSVDNRAGTDSGSEHVDMMDVDSSVPGQTTVDKNVTPTEEDEDSDDDTIQKLHNLEVIPDLYNLLHDLDSGAISARDFDKNSGSIKLKLATMKRYLQEVEGINETVEERHEKIAALTANNERKAAFLSKVRQTIEEKLK